MIQITVFTNSWHVHVSDSLQKIFLDPLSHWVDFQIEEINENFSKKKPSDYPVGPLIFWMDQPPQSWLEHSANRIIWIPMADALPEKNSGHWEQLPKALRIFALSDDVYDIASSLSDLETSLPE